MDDVKTLESMLWVGQGVLYAERVLSWFILHSKRVNLCKCECE